MSGVECVQCKSETESEMDDFCSARCEKRFQEIERLHEARSRAADIEPHDGNARRRARVLALLDSMIEDDDDTSFLPEDKRAANDEELGWIGDYAARTRALSVVQAMFRKTSPELDPRVYDGLRELLSILGGKAPGWRPPPIEERGKGFECFVSLPARHQGQGYAWVHVRWDLTCWECLGGEVYADGTPAVAVDSAVETDPAVQWAPALPRRR